MGVGVGVGVRVRVRGRGRGRGRGLGRGRGRVEGRHLWVLTLELHVVQRVGGHEEVVALVHVRPPLVAVLDDDLGRRLVTNGAGAPGQG